MPEPLTDDQWRARLAEPDEFRLVIRCQSAIEALVDASIERLFTRQWQGRMRRFGGFETRLDLAIAMGAVDAELREGIMALARLRNDLAHGIIDNIPPERARGIARAVGRIVETPDHDDFADAQGRLSPADSIRDMFFLARASIILSADQVFEFRQHGDRLAYMHRVLFDEMDRRRVERESAVTRDDVAT